MCLQNSFENKVFFIREKKKKKIAIKLDYDGISLL